MASAVATNKVARSNTADLLLALVVALAVLKK